MLVSVVNTPPCYVGAIIATVSHSTSCQNPTRGCGNPFGPLTANVGPATNCTHTSTRDGQTSCSRNQYQNVRLTKGGVAKGLQSSVLFCSITQCNAFTTRCKALRKRVATRAYTAMYVHSIHSQGKGGKRISHSTSHRVT